MTNVNVQRVTPKVIGRKRQRVKTNRIPNDLLKCQREEAVPAWKAGRPAYNLGKESASMFSLILELVLREHDKEIGQLRKWLREIDLIVRYPDPLAAAQPKPIRQMATMIRSEVA